MTQNDTSAERSIRARRRQSNLAEEKVVLVNEQDEVVGVENKTSAHQLGSLHRAFSVFILNAGGQLLLQKRAHSKYHSRGLWSNTCCGHPRPGETVEQAARRRLFEEMGFDAELWTLFNFIYYTNLDEGVTEHEYDYVLVGHFDDIPKPDPDEVVDWKWADLTTVSAELKSHPECYTYWFRISFEQFLSSYRDARV